MNETKKSEDNNINLKRFDELDDTKSKNEVFMQCKILKDYDFSISCQFSDKEFSSFEIGGTGIEFEDIREIEYPFDKYIVKIGLTSSNQFLGITEIKLKESCLLLRKFLIFLSISRVGSINNELSTTKSQ